MRVLHIPAIFEDGLRRAILDYLSASADLYESLLWRCGSSEEGCPPHEHVFPRTLQPFNLSLPLLMHSWRQRAAADLVHHHGCWSMTSLAALIQQQRHGLPLVYSPHGALIPASLQRYRLVKSCYLRLWERRVLKAADCFHAVSAVEAAAITAQVGVRPIALIPNGIDLQRIPLRELRADFWDRWRIPGDSFKILLLSRLVVDKGVDLLLQAMYQVRRQVPQAHCILAGDGPPAYLSRLRRMIRDTELGSAVTFIGPLKGEEKFSAYRNADVFVLPSRNEAQGIVVLEALSQNLPVIASRATPYAELASAGCGWWEENEPAALAACLIAAAGSGRPALRAKGEQGRAFLQERYALTRTYTALHQLYAWLLAGQPKDELPDAIQRCC